MRNILSVSGTIFFIAAEKLLREMLKGLFAFVQTNHLNSRVQVRKIFHFMQGIKQNVPQFLPWHVAIRR
jgi:hypothetical protein